MSIAAPSRRLVAGLSCRASTTIALSLRCRPQFQQRRAASGEAGKPHQANPVLDEWKRQNPEAAHQADAPAPQLPQAGDIAPNSIFEDDRRIQQQQERESATDAEEDDTKTGGPARNPQVMARVLDPNPAARQRFERRKVMQLVRKGGRLTKAEFIKRTEREHLVKSHNMKTSIKKLGMLARQIAGKPLDEAITQMRFSKKKVAEEILAQLEAARDEAVVMRGMGLGSTAAEEGEGELETAPTAKKNRPIDIQLKDGKRYKVTDRSRIYIDEAWVGRGPYGKLPDYRARGRVYMMRTPWTSLSVVLKEEATRVREFEEREAKRKRAVTQNVWKHLPDRPVQIQRQWYSW